MTGLSIAAVIEARADGMSIGIDSLLAERHLFFIGGAPMPTTYLGMNLVAILCAGTLLKQRKDRKATNQQEIS